MFWYSFPYTTKKIIQSFNQNLDPNFKSIKINPWFLVNNNNNKNTYALSFNSNEMILMEGLWKAFT